MATVISHEVAHALARHAGERLSQSMLAQAGGLGLGVALGGMGSVASTAIMQGYSLGTQLGILLPYSRSQEYEADRVGLILMAKAGYDPAQALEFWRRMMTGEKGAKLPQFMSSHPSDASRLQELQAFLPEARKYYVPAHAAPSPPPPGSPILARPRAAPPRRPGSGGRPPIIFALIWYPVKFAETWTYLFVGAYLCVGSRLRRTYREYPEFFPLMTHASKNPNPP